MRACEKTTQTVKKCTNFLQCFLILQSIGQGPQISILINRQIIWIFSPDYLYMGPRQSKNGCCGDRSMSNLGAAIGIPFNFSRNLNPQILVLNNMGSLWQPLNWTSVGHHNIHFLVIWDLHEGNMQRKSILFAG